MDLNSLFFAAGETFNTLPESTKEAVLNPAAANIGKALDGIVLTVMMPLLKLKIIKEEQLRQFENEIQQKASEIPEAHRDSSNLGLVLKAIEESRYQLNNDTLRSMFANLIASTVDDRKNKEITPFYVTTVAQMGPKEAELFKKIGEQQYHRLVFGTSIFQVSNQRYISSNTVGLMPDGTKILKFEKSQSILDALGIIQTLMGQLFLDKQAEELYQSLSRITKEMIMQSPEVTDESKIEFRPSGFQLTSFGEDLLRCVAD